MATSQDFANWICGPHLNPDFLRYLLVCEGPALLNFASGSVHQTIYYPELKAFYICLPPIDVQNAIVKGLSCALRSLRKAEQNYRSNLDDIEELRASLMRGAFQGEFPSPNV